jgi:hypothetical protein
MAILTSNSLNLHLFDLNPEKEKAIEAFAKQRNIKGMGRVPFWKKIY